ncbi:MAG: hypothetical protein JRH19_04905 [Deltaproteobacteria bacterium]|nr:hypothetical protein [Deltaproteobacteria bacterium]
MIKRILFLACLVMSSLASLAASAEGIPVQLFVSPGDNGAGGATITLTPDSGQHSFAVWSDFQGAAGGSGAISIQDVLLRASGDIEITGFTCALAECIVGNRSYPRTLASFPSRELVFTAGDDRASSPGLTGLKKVGDLVVEVGEAPGALTLAGGTALDGNAAPGTLQIAQLPNAGILLVPEPIGALQAIFALATLAWFRYKSS